MKIPPGLVGPFIGGFYRLWCRTLRYDLIHRESCEALIREGNSLVFTLWHDEVFAVPFQCRDWKVFTIVSRSTDGEYLARLLQEYDIYPLRGSSSRGGLAALLRGVKIMRDEGRHACITIDGPRGPRHEVKDGALYLAHRAGAYIVPMRVAYSSAKIFGSWDKFALPWPFSRVAILVGEPYKIEAEELTEDVLVAERQRLKQALQDLLPEEGGSA